MTILRVTRDGSRRALRFALHYGSVNPATQRDEPLVYQRELPPEMEAMSLDQIRDWYNMAIEMGEIR